MLSRLSKQKSMDLTTGSISRNLIYMSLPTMAGFFAQTLYDIVDMIWVGRISMEALAGVTISTIVFWMIDVFNNIIGTSSVSVISQYYGKGDLDKTRKAIEQTLTFKSLIAVVAGGIIFILLKPLALFFDSNPKVVQSALQYGYIRLLFLPVMFSSFTVNTALRCIGDSKRPLYLMLISSVVNVVLDPIMIFDELPIRLGNMAVTIPGLGLGVFGAALATVISITIAFGAGFYILISGKSHVKITVKGLLRLDKEIDYKLMTIGLPNGAEYLTRNLSNIVLMKFIALFGSSAIAASGIGLRLLGLLTMPLAGMSMGAGAIVGQNIGVGNLDRVKMTANTAVKIGIIVIGGATVFNFSFTRQIIGMFTRVPEVIEIGVPMLRIFTIGMFPLAILFGRSCVFSGSGYNLPFLIASIISKWLAAIPFAFIAVYVFKAPIVILWVAYAVGDLVEMLVMQYYYSKGEWEMWKVTGQAETKA